VGLGLGNVRRALERQDLAGVIDAQAQRDNPVYGHARSLPAAAPGAPGGREREATHP
jgi:hypothetical protein